MVGLQDEEFGVVVDGGLGEMERWGASPWPLPPGFFLLRYPNSSRAYRTLLALKLTASEDNCIAAMASDLRITLDVHPAISLPISGRSGLLGPASSADTIRPKKR